jgi:hypothetical protein
MRRSVFCAVVIALASVAIDAGAQFSGGGGMGRGGMGGMGGMGGGMRGQTRGPDKKPEAAPIVRRNLVDEIDDRLYMFEGTLRLTSEQQPVWERYADSVRAAAKDVARERDRGELQEKVPVLARLERTVEASRNRFTALEDVTTAARALYDTLSPPQRELCDPRLATIPGLLLEATSQPAIAPRAGR